MIVWSHHVMAAGGMTSVEEFENRFSKYTRQIRLSSGLWARYMRGEVMPQGSLAGNKSSLVARLDVEYPGTATIFYHPLWELLDFDRLFGPAQLKQHYMLMGKHVWKHFVASPSGAALDIEKLRFWKSHSGDVARMRRWGQINGLDGLAVCLIEARLGYLGQIEADFVSGMLGAMGRIARLRDTESFAAKRMQSALLVIEQMCVRYAECLVIQGPPSGESHEEFWQALRNWQKGLETRAHAHYQTLSMTSGKTYLTWVKQIVEHAYPW